MKKNFADAVKEIRIKNKLTQKQFAEKFFITEKAISNYENGIRVADLDFIKKVCEECKNINVELKYLTESKVVIDGEKPYVKIIEKYLLNCKRK